MDARPRHGQVGGNNVGLTTLFPDIGHFKYSNPTTNVEHMHNKHGTSSQQLGTVCVVYDNRRSTLNRQTGRENEISVEMFTP